MEVLQEEFMNADALPLLDEWKVRHIDGVINCFNQGFCMNHQLKSHWRSYSYQEEGFDYYVRCLSPSGAAWMNALFGDSLPALQGEERLIVFANITTPEKFRSQGFLRDLMEHIPSGIPNVRIIRFENVFNSHLIRFLEAHGYQSDAEGIIGSNWFLYLE